MSSQWSACGPMGTSLAHGRPYVLTMEPHVLTMERLRAYGHIACAWPALCPHNGAPCPHNGALAGLWAHRLRMAGPMSSQWSPMSSQWSACGPMGTSLAHGRPYVLTMEPHVLTME